MVTEVTRVGLYAPGYSFEPSRLETLMVLRVIRRVWQARISTLTSRASLGLAWDGALYIPQ